MPLKKGYLIVSVLPVLFLFFVFLPHTALAALSIDGENSVATGYADTNYPPYITLSTTQPNDIIILDEANENNSSYNPPSTISSISDTAGLAWHERTATTSPNMIGSNGNPNSFDLEVWWAYAPSALSSDTITPTFAANRDCSTLAAFGVNGANTTNPWDANGSLPQTAVNNSATYLGGTDADPSASVSTNAANTMLLGFMATEYWGVDNTGNPYSAGSGYTQLAYTLDGSCSLWTASSAEYQVVSTPQSNTTVNFTPPGQAWFMIGDAIQAAPIAPPIYLGAQHANYPAFITTSADAPAGSLIVVYTGEWYGSGGYAVPTVTDSAGNTYVMAVSNTVTPGIPTSAIFYSLNSAHDLPAGGTITATWPAGNGQLSEAYDISGANGGLDVATSTVNTGNVQTVSLSSGTLALPNEVIFAAVNPNNGDSGFTEASGWTTSGVGFGNYDFAYQVANSTASVTYDPSWTASGSPISAVLASFKVTSQPAAIGRIIRIVGGTRLLGGVRLE